MNIPEGILCSLSHEWILEEDNNTIQVGLTDYMIEKLGDVELPEIGLQFDKNEVFATIETIKAASEIYMPISGEIVEINETLINSPELINEEPFNFWLIKVKPNDLQEDIQGLVDYNDYRDEI